MERSTKKQIVSNDEADKSAASMYVSKSHQVEIKDGLEKHYWKNIGKKIFTDWRLYLMVIPVIVVFLLWKYFPLYGLVGAFKNNDTTLDIWLRPFTGLDNFIALLSGPYSAAFWQAFRNTFFLSFYGLLFGFPAPIIIALFFNEIKNNIIRSGIQVLTYLPKFVSTVVVTSLIGMLVKAGNSTTQPGVLSGLMAKMGLISSETAMTGLLNAPQFFRPIYIISGIWETAGYSSIVFFAAVIGISPTNYEAAQIDGASKWAQLRYVVLPGMASTIIIMLVLRIGELLNVGYEKVLLLYNINTYATADIVATYVFRIAGLDGSGGNPNQALGSAADLIAAVLSMVMVIGSNRISKKVSNVSLY